MSLLAQIQTAEISRTINENQGLFEQARQFIVDNFGQNGLYAAYLLLAAIAVLVIYKLIKLGFEIVFFIVLPALISAFVLTFVLPYSFYYLLPATALLFTLGLILRTVAFSKG